MEMAGWKWRGGSGGVEVAGWKWRGGGGEDM